MKLVAHNGNLQCPICDIVLFTIEHKHEVAIEARHPKTSCAWGGWKFRASPLTGEAERIKEKVSA